MKNKKRKSGVSTREWLRSKTCADKGKLSKARADITVDEWASRGTLMYYYICPYCTKYHLTRSEPRNIK